MPKVLVVDDSKLMRSVVSSMLSGAHEVMAIEGWSDLSPAMTSFTPDVVLVDLNMPGLPGERVVEVLRRFWPKTPVIVMSEEAEERLEAARSTLAVPVLRKSELQDLLVKTINDAVFPERDSNPHCPRSRRGVLPLDDPGSGAADQPR